MDSQSLQSVRAQLDFSKPIRSWAFPIAVDIALGVVLFYLLQRRDFPSGVAAALLVPILCFNGFSLMHEAVHRNLSHRHWLNDWIGVVTGTFCFLPFEPWRQMHLEHHLWAGNVERDPVNKLRKDYDPNQVRKNTILSAIWRSWLPLLAVLQHIVFWLYPLQLIKKKGPKRGTNRLFFYSYLIPALLYGALWYVGIPRFSFWGLGAGVFLYFVLVEFVNLPHHLDLPTYRGDTKLNLLDQYQIARSAIYPKWFSQWVLLNFNLHLEHHLFPNLPWHELDKARALVKPILGIRYNETHGSQWLRQHRNQSLGQLLAPSDSKPTAGGRKVA